ncbi:galactose-1-phosphate uridylyltransferase, partial [bacterium]|nr:galactose-1-phosphate uridylyltransferase [bacterium]
SELRYDLISKDWVVIAISKGKKPQGFKFKKMKVEKIAKKDCPFCNIETQRKPTLIYSKGKQYPLDRGIPKDWTTIVIPNLFPVFKPSDSLDESIEGGLYKKMKAVGFQEIIVSKDHEKSLAQLGVKRIKELLDAYQQRYLDLMNEKHVNHISVFMNYGLGSGASQPHPHSQIITTPLIDKDLRISLMNAQKYYQKNKDCVYCKMIRWEKKAKERVIFENQDFLALCPFASKSSFQIIITPKKHKSNFEDITEKEKEQLAEAFEKALKKLYKGLNNPPYNIYLHTAPCDGKKHDDYHWHWTIIPRLSIWAGFEAGVGMEISTISPEDAAKFLRKQ